MAGTVVVGYIPTPQGEAALSRAESEAALRGAGLVVVNASRGDAYIDRNRLRDDAWEDLAQRYADIQLDVTLTRADDSDDIAEAVLDACAEHAAELLVIGLRKRSSVGKLFLGSTAQRILMQSTTPVLAIPHAE